MGHTWMLHQISGGLGKSPAMLLLVPVMPAGPGKVAVEQGRGKTGLGVGTQWEGVDLLATVCTRSYSLFSNLPHPFLLLEHVPVTELVQV